MLAEVQSDPLPHLPHTGHQRLSLPAYRPCSCHTSGQHAACIKAAPLRQPEATAWHTCSAGPGSALRLLQMYGSPLSDTASEGSPGRRAPPPLPAEEAAAAAALLSRSPVGSPALSHGAAATAPLPRLGARGSAAGRDGAATAPLSAAGGGSPDFGAQGSAAEQPTPQSWGGAGQQTSGSAGAQGSPSRSPLEPPGAVDAGMWA